MQKKLRDKRKWMEKAVYKGDVWNNLSDKNYISNFEIFQIIEKCLDIFAGLQTPVSSYCYQCIFQIKN